MHIEIVARCLLIGLICMAGPVLAESEVPRQAQAVDLIDRFGDTTQTLKDGVAYYSSTGVLLVVRDGNLTKGRWTAKDSGELCWELQDTDPVCRDYVVFEDIVYRSESGVITGQPDLTAGNLLADAASALAYANSAVLFTPDETRAFLAGKTSLRSVHGRMFYAPDETLHTVWNGVRKTGTWSIDAEGGVCWHIEGWGEQPCEYYFEGHNGKVWSRFRGLDQVATEHVEGDQTAY
ncbi:MAG: hypothetical protein AAF922_13040 [Pseudomonadota bacterium]